jgi:hypothetical protein
MVCNDLSCSKLLITQLWVLVEITTPGHDLGHHRVYFWLNISGEGIGE